MLVRAELYNSADCPLHNLNVPLWLSIQELDHNDDLVDLSLEKGDKIIILWSES